MKLQPLDLIFVKGNTLISKIIQKITKSPYSHVAIVLNDCHLIEINFTFRLKINHIHYKTHNYDIYRIINLKEEQKEVIIKFLFKSLGKKYDFIQAISYFFKFLFGWKVINLKSRYICSEVIDVAFRKAGIKLVPEIPLGEVTPADLVKSKLLIKI